MTGYILCDISRDDLLPFTYTRPAADCRAGILTLREKWEYRLQQQTSTLTADHLAEKFPLEAAAHDNFWIHGGLVPDDGILAAMQQLQPGEALVAGNTWLMSRRPDPPSFGQADYRRHKTYRDPFILITRPWEIAQQNDRLLRDDFTLLTSGRRSEVPDGSNRVIAPGQVFLEKGASVLCATLNASAGPIYIGKEAQVMEGAVIRGPFALGEKAVVKMGAAIYGATTIGPASVAGGEIKNSVIFGYSNKAHDGYLGDAVVGEWCNLAAGTSCSNLKNNIGTVRVWHEAGRKFMDAGLKCGMLMGDLSRTGVNTAINTGTLIGVSCHVFGTGFPPVYIPSFSWGGNGGLEEYRLDKALQDAGAWMQLKGKEISGPEQAILQNVFNHTSSYRKQSMRS